MKLLDYSCQTYEGGFSGCPGMEAHGGYAFCGLAALVILQKGHLIDHQSLLVRKLLCLICSVNTFLVIFLLKKKLRLKAFLKGNMLLFICCIEMVGTKANETGRWLSRSDK